MDKLSVIILTFNEERHIERCLKSLRQVTNEIFIVDSYSTDRTVAIAEAMGAKIWQNKFINYANQFSWALSNLPINSDWVMRLDADEIISPSLAQEIQARLQSASSDIGGFLLCRYVRFKGAEIRHGGLPHWLLRIWRTGIGEIEQRWMDEHIVLKSGRIVKMKGAFIDDNLNNITWWTDKHNKYATREVVDLLNQKYNFSHSDSNTSQLTFQARYKRWLKKTLYSRLPLGTRAFLFFLYRMIFQLGFLDGKNGFTFHFLQGFWYRYLVDVKMQEVEKRMCNENITFTEALQRELGVSSPL